MLNVDAELFFVNVFLRNFYLQILYKNISPSSAIGEKLRKENFWSDCTYKPNKCTISIALGK